MKKILFLIMFLMITVVANAFDIIVKKDGSTIQAKVEKVTATEVEYKKASNPDGPTYTVSIAELISINYQNGSKDVFTSTNDSSNTHSTTHTGFVTDETASRYSQDKMLIDLYHKKSPAEIEINKGKKIKNISLYVGGAFFIGGAFASFIGDPEGWNNITDGFTARDLGYCLMGVGLIGGTTGFIIGNNMVKKAQNRITTSAILSKDILIADNQFINVGINLINDNTR